MDIRKFSEVYLPILLVAGGAIFGYATLANDVSSIKDAALQQQSTATAVARLEEQQKATTKTVDRIETKLDNLIEALRKDN